MTRELKPADVLATFARCGQARGFELKAGQLFSYRSDLTQVVAPEFSNVDTLQVICGIHLKAVGGASAPRLVDDCHIQGMVLAMDGSEHLRPADFFESNLVTRSAESLAEWCEYIYATTISHFFLVFDNPDRCADIVRSGRIRRMRVNTREEYRDHLGMKHPPGEWVFSDIRPLIQDAQPESSG